MDDETLEVGIAAGLDIPTAIVLADENDDEPRPRKPPQPQKVGGIGSYGGWAVLTIVVAIVVAVVWWLLH
jgi:hypothetical protein